MVNIGLLTAEICWRVCGTPANFDRFCVFVSLFHDLLLRSYIYHCVWSVITSILTAPTSLKFSTEFKKTLQDAWPSPGLVHYVYICGGAPARNGILPAAKFTLRPSLGSPILAALLHNTRAYDKR